MLVQTLVSYLAQGWPPSQIVIFDNTGHATENAEGSTDPYMHYFLNHTHIRYVYGVAVYAISRRLTFAECQNLFLHVAQREDIYDFFWAHQDVVVMQDETLYPSLFEAVVAEKRELVRKFGTRSRNWAVGYFDYDKLAHVNVLAADVIGLWDIRIPYYPSDCDYYGRARRAGLYIFDFPAARFFDVAVCLTNPQELFASAGVSAQRRLESTLKSMAVSKAAGDRWWHFWLSDRRNIWQGRNADGSISPDFGDGWRQQIVAGRKFFKHKWGTSECDISCRNESTIVSLAATQASEVRGAEAA
ncbi:hypothetical protein LTR70_007649 [Exophiala xenobiotica]|uniref:Uncharacterized protein n=1 Tax=Lithohypha guttulata TaxID=1690604 RepID=A0ABR0K3D5_9EURO|nr:hypothetical protein LTR24_007918 [Lithohypha guttulata]KAK5313345.1 hypothetical protein LTR70_007649 [Exophiala xenobiotica]